MVYDDHNPTGAAPAKAPAADILKGLPATAPHMPDNVTPSSEPPSSPLGSAGTDWQPPFAQAPSPSFRAAIPEDLRVSWGWHEIAVFVILGFVATVLITWGMGEVAVKIFGIPRTDLFGDSMSTAKSVIVLISQALLDSGAILFLYLMLLTRTTAPGEAIAPFWRSIGWREMRHGTGTIRHSWVQFLAGGAVLAIAITFLSSFMSSKETLPIEELLKARVSMFLFAVLGVLVAPLVEETVFRGFLYPVLARQWGITSGIVITGALFGLMHAAQLWGGWGQIALLIGVGITLTWVRARTGTVATSYFVHLGYNGLQLAGYLIYVIGGLRH